MKASVLKDYTHAKMISLVSNGARTSSNPNFFSLSLLTQKAERLHSRGLTQLKKVTRFKGLKDGPAALFSCMAQELFLTVEPFKVTELFLLFSVVTKAVWFLSVYLSCAILTRILQCPYFYPFSNPIFHSHCFSLDSGKKQL